MKKITLLIIATIVLFGCNNNKNYKTSNISPESSFKEELIEDEEIKARLNKDSIISQNEFEFNFLENDFLLYKGQLLIINKDATSGFGNTFYNNLKYCKDNFNDNVLYPEKQYKWNTSKNLLSNRIFKVENIVDKNGNTWTNEMRSPYGLDEPIFILKDTITNQIIYFKYNTQYDFEFPFLCSKINYSKEYLSSKLDRRLDDFTGKISISTPVIYKSELSPVIMHKDIQNEQIVYYLSLNTKDRTLSTNNSGVIILFTDGTKWSADEKINVEAGDKRYYNYSVFIKLTDNDVIALSKKKINKFRLGIYDESVNSIFADKFMMFVNCLKDAK